MIPIITQTETEWPRTKEDHDTLARLVKWGKRSGLLNAGTIPADCMDVPSLRKGIIDIMNGRYRIEETSSEVTLVRPSSGGMFLFHRRSLKDNPKANAERWLATMENYYGNSRLD